MLIKNVKLKFNSKWQSGIGIDNKHFQSWKKRKRKYFILLRKICASDILFGTKKQNNILNNLNFLFFVWKKRRKKVFI